ncbi:UDP-glucose/GDP-mannose dehydrogenase family protein [Microbacterium sp. M28]|uniref:UDP-glucose dehydrogenase family protein n=1 Tax=Microbacterium sp. M28 TaxID=2962064 RepID=UPI0021F3D608|nr:UDP-glucose/GDP-mannose dehydrogenase family protein [Microbacterium sp. M28]UYO98348.1 UDP-glucose/GDP-mannose dehydrogenase family protein [Microbacterium sp. M28]
MRMSVIGCGYLGAVHAAAMASIGHDVVGVDVDAARIAALRSGRAPFFEPDLDDLLAAGLASGRLRFTDEMSAASGADIHFLAVGTPQRPGAHAADLRYVDAAVDALVPYLRPGDLLAGKSTVPVGTAAGIAERISPSGAVLVWNPEFLREGWAVHDTITPDRIVVGVPDGADGERAATRLREAYGTALESGAPFLVTDLATAELVKGAANAFLATKVSFINAMAEIAEAVGADVTLLADALGHDTRIGRRYLGSGIGFGGGCLPKDIRAFAARAEELGHGDAVGFLREVDAINLRRRDRAVQMVVDALDGRVHGTRVAVLGAAFKPFSDDIRDSPALEVAVRLRGLGADVVVTDPAALENARALHPQLAYADDRDEALRGADAVVLVTEWDLYRREMDPDRAGALVARRIIVDGRNCLDPSSWRAADWRYHGMGRR